MATLDASNVMVWTGDVTAPCEEIDFREYSNKISSTYAVNSVDGSLLATKKPAMAGFSPRNRYYGAGIGGLFYVEETGTELEDAVVAPSNSDNGRVIPTYTEHFYAMGATGGKFVMTTDFKNSKPVYKQVEHNWYIWYDKSDDNWVASEGTTDRLGKFLLNDSCLPQYNVYSNEDYNPYTLTTQNFECVSVTNLLGSVEDANGVYCSTGFYNDEPSYVHCSSEWFIYFDKTEWLISKHPYNRGGSWISNGSKSLCMVDFNNTSNMNGSQEFTNQIAKVECLGVPESALLAEDGETPLFIEDDENVVTHEA